MVENQGVSKDMDRDQLYFKWSDCLNVRQQSYMKGANLVQVLANTLNPSTTNSSFQLLSNMKGANGFAIELLVISDDRNYEISIRQSALIYLKNVIQDHCRSAFLPPNDVQTIKESLLEALIRNVTNRKLTPTYREIIYKMAETYYPKQWPSIVDNSVNILQQGTDLQSLLGAVQALKAIYSVFGGSVSKQIELNNLCNRSLIPLLTLASKLFQNFNQQTSYVLVCIFKLLNTAIMFYMPEMIILNIHSIMIFVKKILDLPADLSLTENENLYLLKRISLRILFRMYQKHAHLKMTSDKEFALQFHAKYTKPLLETLILQVMLKVEGDKNARQKIMDLIKISLSSIAYINRQNTEAALLLVQSRDSILKLCMDKFRTPLSRNYQSFNEFKIYMQENRAHLKQLVFSMLSCDAIPERQADAASAILSLLLEYLQKGDDEYKELALYLFTWMANELKYLTDKLDQKMIMLVLNYVRPLLSSQDHIMIRARCCQLIASYSYLDYPEDQMTEMAKLIYNCLLAGNSQKEVFLKIFACHAFNSIMRYDAIAEFIKPYIPQILQIYTELLQADSSIIKNFEDLIDLLDDAIAPFANDITKILINMFLNYTQSADNGNQQFIRGNRDENQEEEDEGDEGEDDEDPNHSTNARACIYSIRQILQSSATVIEEGVRNQLFDLMVWVFSDSSQIFMEEGYNILNLLLYKLEGQANSKYFLFFRVIVYAILGLPQHYIDNLQAKGDNFSLKFAQILANICLEPDNDIIENTIGCLRNFVAKSSGGFFRSQRDQFNISYMQYLLKLVRFVHQNQSGKASQTERLIVLTILITLIEYQRVDQKELTEILSLVMSWMQMEQEAIQAEILKNQGSPFGKFGSNAPKYTYTSVYLQIILLAVNFYDKAALQYINLPLVIRKVVILADNFKCDYEISRIIVGFSHILNSQMVSEESIVREMLNVLPELVRRLCNIRQEGDNHQNDLDMDDQAEEERAFGEDQNTHIMGWQQGGSATDKDLMLKGEEEEDDNDWEEEFNKFYLSPLEQNDELKYLEDVMKRLGHIYGPYMSQDSQQKLSLYLSNAPPKNNQN